MIPAGINRRRACLPVAWGQGGRITGPPKRHPIDAVPFSSSDPLGTINESHRVAVRTTPVAMISDDDLYRLAIFLGSVAMVLIVVYHFFEVNSADSALAKKAAQAKPVQQAPAVGKSSSVAK
ncbi:hypothetical protein JX265_004961 [Neoarthrinium moseri]|uniref:Dolichyl-diphosphooligosaccharide--protein glycosyltransferase subunit 4 n=1 Tax=Neoarthrinium moseri TaxID=1658444 RepID=A0A9Q0ARZ1_9PEZI|nr:hypothetical protein JX265_004961 [Neoarthrinium moseri]